MYYFRFVFFFCSCYSEHTCTPQNFCTLPQTHKYASTNRNESAVICRICGFSMGFSVVVVVAIFSHCMCMCGSYFDHFPLVQVQKVSSSKRGSAEWNKVRGLFVLESQIAYVVAVAAFFTLFLFRCLFLFGLTFVA